MRPTNLELAKQEILRLQSDLTTVENRLESLRKSVQKTLSDLLGPQHTILASLREEEVVAKAVELVLNRLPHEVTQKPNQAMKYVHDTAAAQLIGVSVGALRQWRSKHSPKGPPYVRIGKLILYPVAELEEYMNTRMIRPRT